MNNENNTSAVQLLMEKLEFHELIDVKDKELLNLFYHQFLEVHEIQIIRAFSIGRGFESIENLNQDETYVFTDEELKKADESIELAKLYYKEVYIDKLI